MTTDLTRTAQKNANYYLSEQKAEQGEKRWFRNVRTMDSYTEPVEISTEMAQELLEAEEASSLRKAGLKSNTVSISFSGKLLAGREALQEILHNRRSAIVFVSFNISDKLSFLFN